MISFFVSLVINHYEVPHVFTSMKWVFHENQGSFHSDHMFLMVTYNASSRWQICASWMMLFIEILDT